MFFVGFIMGLVGGGGAILLVPILVYLSHFNVLIATSYSLFIIGITSAIGGINFAFKKMVNYKIALIFVVPSMCTVFIVRRFIIPNIPEIIFDFGNFYITKHSLIMLLFAVLLICSSYSMLSNKFQPNLNMTKNQDYKLILLVGIFVGIISGMIGAGGGFLIIPALILFAALPMKMAIGTSLLIIAINSLSGFFTDILHANTIDWRFLFSCTSIAILGMFAGVFSGNFIPSLKLKKIFGVLSLLVVGFIIIKELL